MAFKVPEQYRVTTGPLATTAEDGNNGMFIIPLSSKHKTGYGVIASDGAGWEHVSVSLQTRIPTWEEMCHIKSLFWGEEDCVVQYHPPKSQYVNNHPYCLHLWKPTEAVMPMPPSIMVGVAR